MAASLLSGFIKALNLLIGYLDTESMIALVVGKFKPFGYYALNCMFGLINSFPSASRNFKHKKNFHYQQLGVLSGLKHMHCKQIYPR